MQAYSITVGFSPTLYCWTLFYNHRGNRLNVTKRFCLRSLCSHLNVLIFSHPAWRMRRRFRCVQIFLLNSCSYSLLINFTPASRKKYLIWLVHLASDPDPATHSFRGKRRRKDDKWTTITKIRVHPLLTTKKNAIEREGGGIELQTVGLE